MSGRDGFTHGRLRRIHWPLVEYGRYTAINGPSVAALGGGVIKQVEGQDLAMPARLSLKILMKELTTV